MTVAAAPALRLEFFVLGQPRTKGSLRPWFKHTWREDGECELRHGLSEVGGFPLAQWRTRVSQAAARAMGQRPPLTGPVYVGLSFRLPRPGSHKGLERLVRWVFTRRRDDLDKLTRCILDCLTDAAVYEDDGQVARLGAEKVYADGQPLGVRVVLEALG